MKRLVASGVTAMVVAGAIACGGDDGTGPDHVLQLPYGTISQEDLRVEIRQMAVAQPDVLQVMCNGLEQLSASEAVEAFAQLYESPGATPLDSSRNDEARFAEILGEECRDLVE